VSFATVRRIVCDQPHGHAPQPLRQPNRGHHPAFGYRRDPRRGVFLHRQAGSEDHRQRDQVDQTFERSFGKTGLDDLDKALEDVGHQVKVQVTRSFHAARKHGNPKKLLHCVEGANGNAHRIRRCAVKY
jgi:hypothetical protein